MNPNDFAPPSGTAVSFKTVGESVTGTVAYVGDWREFDGKFGKKTSCKITLDTADGPLSIYPEQGSWMARSIGEAMRVARRQELVGANLTVTYAGQKDTGKGNPAKVFEASISDETSAPVANQFDTESEPF